MQSIPRIPSIYQIRHIASGRVYVGSATDTRQRWYSHRSLLSSGTHTSSHLQNAWNKYGETAFVFEILEPVLFVEDLTAHEQYWIDKLQAADPCYGFNILKNARSSAGSTRSPETRAKVSAAKRAQSQDPVVRERLTEQSRAYWSSADSREKARAHQQGIFADPEARARASAKQRAYVDANPEVRTRQSVRTRALWDNPEFCAMMSERVIQQYILTDPDGNEYQVGNLAAFCREHGLTRRCFDYVLNGTRPHHKGWKCRRKE